MQPRRNPSSEDVEKRLKEFCAVKDIMSASVFTVKPDDTLDHAFSVMAKNDIRGLPVVQPGENGAAGKVSIGSRELIIKCK